MNEKRLLRWFAEILTTETETQSASLSALFPSLRVKFRLWVTTFCHLIPVRFKKKKKKRLSVSLFTVTHPLLFLNGAIVGWWCSACESTLEHLLERERGMCHRSTMRTAHRYYRASHLLFGCGAGSARRKERLASTSVGGWAPERHIFLIKEPR